MGGGASAAAKPSADGEKRKKSPAGEHGDPQTASPYADESPDSSPAGSPAGPPLGQPSSGLAAAWPRPVKAVPAEETVAAYRAVLLAQRIDDSEQQLREGLADSAVVTAALAAARAQTAALVLSDDEIVLAINAAASKLFPGARSDRPGGRALSEYIRMDYSPRDDVQRLVLRGVHAQGIGEGDQRIPLLVSSLQLQSADQTTAVGYVIFAQDHRGAVNGICKTPPALPLDAVFKPGPSPRASPRSRGSSHTGSAHTGSEDSIGGLGASTGELKGRSSAGSAAASPGPPGVPPLRNRPAKRDKVSVRGTQPAHRSAARSGSPRRQSEISGACSSAPTDVSQPQDGAPAQGQRRIRPWAHGDISLTVDSAGIVQGTSHGAQRYLGLSAVEALGRELDSFLAPGDSETRSLKALVADGEAALLRGEEERTFMVINHSAIAEPVYLASLCDFRGPDGEPWEVMRLLLLQDSAPRRGLLMAAAAKSAVSEDMAAVFGHMPVPTIVTTEAGEMVYANDVSLRTFGYEEHELLGEDVSMLVPFPWRTSHSERVRLVFLAGNSGVLRGPRGVCAVTRSGHILPLRMEISHLTTPQGKDLFVCSASVVSEDSLAQIAVGPLARLVQLTEQCRADPRNLALARGGSEASLQSRKSSVRSMQRLTRGPGSMQSLGTSSSFRRLQQSQKQSPGSPRGSPKLLQHSSPPGSFSGRLPSPRSPNKPRAQPAEPAEPAAEADPAVEGMQV